MRQRVPVNSVPKPYTIMENATKQHGRVYVCNGYEYILSREQGPNLYLVCRRFRTRGINCKGKAIVRNGDKEKLFEHWNHSCTHIEYEEPDESVFEAH